MQRMPNISLWIKTGSFLIVSWFLVSCLGHRSRADTDFTSVARIALAVIEQGRSKVTLVVPDSIDMQAKSALGSLRKAITPEGVPASKDFSLPEGYFLLRKFSISGDDAIFEGNLGPVEQRISPKDIIGCGELYLIPMHRSRGIWVVGDYTKWVC